MDSLLVYIAPGESPDLLELVEVPLETREIGALGEADPGERPAILFLSRGLLKGISRTEWETLPAHVAVVASDAQARGEAEKAGRLFLSMEDLKGDGPSLTRALRSAVRHSAALLGQARSAEAADRVQSHLAELNKVGLALMSERDPEILLGMILTQARALTGSDAGSLYLVEEDPESGGERLHFLRAQNDSLPELPQPDFTLPLDRSSLAGWAATTGEILVLDDAYRIPADAPYSFNRGFDTEHGYRAKSMLIAPMVDHRDRVVGVLQLINRKDDPTAAIRSEEDAAAHVLPYGEAEVATVQSLAGQAAVSIENGLLYRDIENLFEGFIKAAVTAIDQRDPTTSGHSVRVATLTCDLAEVLDRTRSGPFAKLRFSREQMRELRYAGLLHDFGKVGVREEVLVKAKKLSPVMDERISARFRFIHRTLEADFHRKRAEHLLAHGGEGFDAFLEELEAEYRRELERLETFQTAIVEANEPRVLPGESAEILQEIAATTFRGHEEEAMPYLTGDELHFLTIPKGSLDPDERLQIESHVTHTYNFLRQIPWTEDLARVAEIAFGHHEKMDGTGYPRRVKGDEIPVQTRIMTVSDIFDALTASDRPYKRALGPDRALEILRMESDAGQLDAAVVDVLLESEVYRRILEEDWRAL